MDPTLASSYLYAEASRERWELPYAGEEVFERFDDSCLRRSRMKFTVVSMSRIDAGTSSSGRVSGISLPFRAMVRTTPREAQIRTPVNQAHSDVKLGQVELATVVDIRKRPEVRAVSIVKVVVRTKSSTDLPVQDHSVRRLL